MKIKEDPFRVDLYQKVGMSDEYVRLHVMRCVPTDLPSEECKRLALNACNVACLSTDVLRGRLDARLLKNIMATTIIAQLVNTSRLLLDGIKDPQRQALDFVRNKHLPVVPRSFNATLISCNKFDAFIGMTVGTDICWANIVLSRIGSRWMCTFCDIG